MYGWLYLENFPWNYMHLSYIDMGNYGAHTNVLVFSIILIIYLQGNKI